MRAEYLGRMKKLVFDERKCDYVEKIDYSTNPIVIIYADVSKEKELLEYVVVELINKGWESLGGYDGEGKYGVTEWFSVADRDNFRDFMEDYKELKKIFKDRK